MLSKHIKYFPLLFGFQQIPISLSGTGFVPILSDDVAKVSTLLHSYCQHFNTIRGEILPLRANIWVKRKLISV